MIDTYYFGTIEQSRTRREHEYIAPVVAAMVRQYHLHHLLARVYCSYGEVWMTVVRMGVYYVVNIIANTPEIHARQAIQYLSPRSMIVSTLKKLQQYEVNSANK